MRFFLSIVLNAVALYIVAELFDSVYLKDFKIALLASFLLFIVNSFVRPILIILTLPVTIVTFGLFLIIINAMMLMITQWMLKDAFVIDSFTIGIVASIVVSLISMILHRVTATPRR